jgi:hypothetical protein
MGDPIPPGQSLLGNPRDLVARGREDGLTIAWSMPSRTLAGGPGAAASFYIERATLPEGSEDCATCAGSYSEAGQFASEGDLALHSWTDSSAEPGKSYSYRVYARDARGSSSAPSAPVAATYYGIEKPAVEVIPADGGATVRYSMPDPTIHYEGLTVYGPDDKLITILEEGKTEARLTGFRNGETIRLAFRTSAVTPQGWRIESAPAYFDLTPRDEEPPLPPRELAVFTEGAAVRLMWMAPQGEQYARVFIYRAPAEGEFAKIGEAGGGDSFYLDSTATAGATYLYGCTGVDEAGNESGMSPAARVKIPERKDESTK